MTASNQPLILIHESSNSLIYFQAAGEYDRPVVIKVLNTEQPTAHQLVRFNNEYEFTRELAVDGVRKSIAQTRLEDKPALILEYITGQTLKQAFEEQRQSLVDFLQVAIRIAQTLGELHQHHIIHRDINSHNILVNLETKEVKIIDFSLASRLDLRVQHLGNPERLAGTLAYISPEQTGRMNRTVDYRTDLYSLGATFYELLTGHLPFESDDPLALVHAHLAKAPRPVTALNPDVPSILSDIVLKLLAKNAEERYQSAFGLQADLERCLAALTDRQGFKNLEALSFELGQADYSSQFHIPQKLYGRSTEIATLLTGFERAAAGSQELMLVTGHPGIGKSALVAEVHKPITEKHGYFISGKFDQYQQHTPYAAFSQAFNQWADLLLTEPATTLQQWRDKILAALGSNGAVLTEVMPSLEKVIGQQPAVTKLGGQENRNRFNLTIQNFVQAISTADHPLVIFIDDCQWADLASLELLKVLMTNEANSHLLLLGAYRDNEVGPAHPLRLTVEDVRQAGQSVDTIALAPLRLADIQQLVADTLGCGVDRARPLSEWVYQKTRGNPFFIIQFLKSFYDEGWLTFNVQAGYWQWDPAQVTSLELADDVVEFMSQQLRKLPPETQKVVQLAACIGNQFDLETLALVHEKAPTATAADVWPVLQAGLLVPLGDIYTFSQDPAMVEAIETDEVTLTYRFFHDRVQQAAYALIPAAEKESIHHKIGQLLLRNIPETERENRIFEIVNQLNMAQTLLADDSERYHLAELNLIAGRKAKTATAYNAAVQYCAIAVDLLPAESWHSHYELTLALYEEAAEAAYLNSDYAQMEQWVETVLAQAQNLLDTVKVYETKIQAARSQGQPQAVMTLALQVLKLLQVEFPDQPTPADFKQALATTRQLWQDRPILSLLEAPAMREPDKLAAMRIISYTTSSAYRAAPALAILLGCKQVEFSLTYGHCPVSVQAYAGYGTILCSVEEDLEAGYQFGQLALQLLERFQAIAFKSRAIFIVHAFDYHWHEPLRSLIQPCREGYQIGLTTGDLDSSAMNALQYGIYSYWAGQELTGLALEMETFQQAIRQLRQESVLFHHQIYQQTVLNLLGQTDDPCQLAGPVYDEKQWLTHHQQRSDRTALSHFYTNKTILAYFFGQLQAAAQHARLAQQYADGTRSQVVVPIFHFYHSLIQLALYPTTTESERADLMTSVAANQAKLKTWAAYAPENHQHKYDLVEAERQRVLGDKVGAVEAYERAITGAKTNEYLQEEALAYELAARFYLEWGQERIARLYLTEAYEAYTRWGAIAKVVQLEQQYAWLLASSLGPQGHRSTSARDRVTSSSTSSTVSVPLDLMTAIKASQAIAGEIELERLLQQMMRIVLENSGAQRGALLLEQDGSWVIQAQGDMDNDEIAVLQALDLQMSTAVSPEIVTYVAHTRTSVVLDDAAGAGDFSHDLYIRQHGVKSVLCAPLVNQGRLSGIVYLENNLTTRAFTAERLELLNLLSTQMALSLDNARLYQQAQQEIAERKRAEEALRLTRFTVERVADAVYWIDPEAARIVDVNEAACHMLGYTREELLNLSVPDIDPEFSLAEWPETWKVIKETGKLIAERKHRTKDDRIIPVELIANYIQFGDRELDCAIVRDITERKQAEETLRLTRFTVEHMFDALYWIDPNARIVDVNEAACRMLGYTHEEFTQMAILDIDAAPPFDVQPGFAEQLRQTGTATFETQHRAKDGRLVPVEIVANMIRFEDQEFNCCFVRDITERKQAEEALRESEEKYRSLVESAQDPIFTCDVDGRYLFVNAAAAAMFSLTPDKVVGKSAYELFSAHIAEEYLVNVRQVFHTGKGLIAEAESEINGQPYWFSTNLQPIRDQHGYVKAVQAVVRDISDLKRTERMLQTLNAAALAMQSALTPDQIFKAVSAELKKVGFHCAIFITVEDRRSLILKHLSYAQQTIKAVEKLTGLNADKVIIPTDRIDAFRQAIWEGKTVFIEDVREPTRQFLSGPLKKLAGPVIEILQIPKSINAPLIVEDEVIGLFSAQSNDLSENDGPAIMAFANQLAAAWRQAQLLEQAQQELAAREQAEKEIRRLNEELEQRVVERTAQLEAANKELEAFSYSVSHDLRAPLRAIDGYTRMLVEDYEAALDAEGQRVCTVIHHQTQRMGELIDDLLTFSRLSRVDMRAASIDMEAMANAVFQEVTTPDERERIELRLESLPAAEGDPILIRQVWANLLAFAVKFSAKREQAVIEVSGRQEAAENIYYVRDNGAGFEMQYADKLFGVFQRLHSEREFEGTGVGLAIIQRVIHRHGGRVWAEGQVDQGATFYFTLPQKEEKFR